MTAENRVDWICHPDQEREYERSYVDVFETAEDIIELMGLDIRCSNIDSGRILAHSGMGFRWPTGFIDVRVYKQRRKSSVWILADGYYSSNYPAFKGLRKHFFEKMDDILDHRRISFESRMTMVKSEVLFNEGPKVSFDIRPPYQLTETDPMTPIKAVIITGVSAGLLLSVLHGTGLFDLLDSLWPYILLTIIPFFAVAALLKTRRYSEAVNLHLLLGAPTILFLGFLTFGIALFLVLPGIITYHTIVEQRKWQALFNELQGYQEILSEDLPVPGGFIFQYRPKRHA
jgi:hypothetical protein